MRRLPPLTERPLHLLHRPRGRWGGLRSGAPLHPGWGRGEHVDRVFVDRFFTAQGPRVTGEVLEIQAPVYADRFGRGVTRTVVFDLGEGPGVDLVADLAVAGSLPTAAFDAIILPQTLQFVPEPDLALQTLHDALRPGGSLLLTVPGLSQTRAASLGPDADFPDLWRWTSDGLRHQLARAFPADGLDVRSYGSLTTALAFLVGLGAGELFGRELAAEDPRFPVLVTACATRAP